MRKIDIVYFHCLILAMLVGRLCHAQTSIAPGRNISFEDAVLLSLEHNPGLKEAERYSKMKEQEVKSARGLYFPKVSLDASWIIMSDDIHLDLTPVQDAITPLYSALGNYGTFSGVPNPDPSTNAVMPVLPDEIATQAVRAQLLDGLETIESAEWNKMIQKKSFGFVSAGFTYPLYAGGKIRLANQAADIRYNEALNEADIKRSQMITELVERYFGLVLAREALEVRKEVYQTMEVHLSDAQHLKDEGMIANAEYLHARVFHSSSERELKKSKRQVDIAEEGLLNTLSIEKDQQIIPVSCLFYADTIESLNYFVENASLNSDLLEKVNHKQELANAKYQLEKGELFPSVAAMGTYDLLNKDLSPYVPEYAVGVGLKWDLFQGASRYRNIKAAQIQKEQVDFVYDKAESDITTAIIKYYEELHMYLEQLHDLETAQAFAAEYYRVRNKAFSEGMATSSDVSDANLALAKVKIERLQAMYQYDISLAHLLYYAGLMDRFDDYRYRATQDRNALGSNPFNNNL